MDRYSNVLVFCTHPDNTGGVANLYRTLKQRLPKEFFYFYVGSRKSRSGMLFLPLLLFRFFLILCRNNIRGMIFNPSLGVKSLVRDSFFITIAKFLSIRHVVFFHGWDSTLLKHPIWRRLFKFVTKGNCTILVLAESFKSEILQVSPSAHIEVFKTAIESPDPAQVLTKLGPNIDPVKHPLNILYLGRLEENKGVLEVISAARTLNDKNPGSVVLHIAGGGALQGVIQGFSKQSSASFLRFHGYVRGEQKRKLLVDCDIFALPTRHGEGLPVAVLEAMAYGLCVVAPLVGGLKCQVGGDVIKQLQVPSESELFEALLDLQDNPDERMIRQQRGFRMAKRFDAKLVAHDLVKILDI